MSEKPYCDSSLYERLCLLVHALESMELKDAEAKQLALEARWLRDGLEKGILSIPTNWELTLIQVSKGNAGAVISKYPDLIQAAKLVGSELRARVQKQIG